MKLCYNGLSACQRGCFKPNGAENDGRCQSPHVPKPSEAAAKSGLLSLTLVLGLRGQGQGRPRFVGPQPLSHGGVRGEVPSPKASSDQLSGEPGMWLLQGSNHQNAAGSVCVHRSHWAETAPQDTLHGIGLLANR